MAGILILLALTLGFVVYVAFDIDNLDIDFLPKVSVYIAMSTVMYLLIEVIKSTL